MSETGILTLTQGIFGLIATLFGGYLTYKIAVLQRQNDAIHVLVNSQYGSALKISAVALRRVADTSKSPDDIKAAIEAERALAEHIQKQEIVDAVNRK